MAEIDIQKKKPSAWLWIIGLIILVLLIWLAFNMFSGRGGTSTRRTGAVPIQQTEQLTLATVSWRSPA